MQGVDAQVQRRGLQHAGGQGLELVAHLGLQGIGHPLGQVVAVLGQQFVGSDGIALVQPLGFLLAQRGLEEIARGVEAQDGEAALLGAAARAGQRFKQGLLAQHGVRGFGQGGALARPQVAVVAEIAGHHGVGGVLELEGQLDQFGASVEEGFGMHSPYCPIATKSRCCAGCCGVAPSGLAWLGAQGFKAF